MMKTKEEYSPAQKDILKLITEIPKRSLTEKKIQRLVEMGLKKQCVKQQDINLFLYYLENYPRHRFITREQVKEICKKHKLLIGGPSDYDQDIPENVLKDIASFELRECDCLANCERPGPVYYYNNFISVWQPFGKKKCNDPIVGYKMPRFFIIAPYSHWAKYPGRKLVPVNDISVSYRSTFFSAIKISLRKKFDPDPIAVQEVYGGYLVVKMWGAEAELPELNDNN